MVADMNPKWLLKVISTSRLLLAGTYFIYAILNQPRLWTWPSFKQVRYAAMHWGVRHAASKQVGDPCRGYEGVWCRDQWRSSSICFGKHDLQDGSNQPSDFNAIVNSHRTDSQRYSASWAVEADGYLAVQTCKPDYKVIFEGLQRYAISELDYQLHTQNIDSIVE